uniref:Uncharacterized protein n=1 Tax=Oryza rufipogon TaxID=4529 RepID=A0A0E0RA32_ORYRU
MALLGASSKRVEKAKANIIIRKMNSKFKLRMFCRTTGAIALLKLSQPNADELGYADSVSLEDIGGVRNEEGRNSVAIAVLRGSTDSILDDLGRAVDDGVNTYKMLHVPFCGLARSFMAKPAGGPRRDDQPGR